ncbi:ATPase AAA [Candidatus Magnetomorum sp. HK-1]|nr:ATPase AAA [Candidatus Magnetomorum sp. HK-1]
MSLNNNQLYEGKGQSGKELPDQSALIDTVNPKNYIAEQGLCDAINVALALGQPLIVTGEPGTGKTVLASSIAHEYSLPDPLEFHTKTTSTAKDLFYQYDALRRFQDSQISKKTLNTEDYLTFQPLGISILLTNPSSHYDKYLPEKYQNIKRPTRTVILIDEIDKAPRDLPNDVLIEIERMQFTIQETGKTIIADRKYRPIIVLTSNSEKNLPDAFLRRCIFYHIPFPSQDQLFDIVKNRFKDDSSLSHKYSDKSIKAAISHFEDIRKLNLKKKPATAEFLAWLSMLNILGLNPEQLTQKIASSYTVLAKTQEDLDTMIRFLKSNSNT